jgi:hypothetical protein
MKKEIVQENGTITIIGNNQWKEIQYDYDEEDDLGDALPYFDYKGYKYYLNDILRTEHEGIFKEYDGYMNESAFSGLLVKLNDSNDALQVYRYFC